MVVLKLPLHCLGIMGQGMGVFVSYTLDRRPAYLDACLEKVGYTALYLPCTPADGAWEDRDEAVAALGDGGRCVVGSNA